MRTLLAVSMLVLLAGCVSAPPGSRSGWSISLVNIQLGGTSTTVDTVNNLQGTNIVQRHSVPIDAVANDPTTITPAVTP